MMKRLLLGLIAAFLVTSHAAEDKNKGGDWLTNLPKALEMAKKEDKDVLLDFTGSDWCAPCKALAKNVFSTSQFQEYAEKNLILVEIDFPLRKKLPSGLKKANERLKKKYKIVYFPTLLLLDSTGRELGRDDGYVGQDTDWFISQMESFKAKSSAKVPSQ